MSRITDTERGARIAFDIAYDRFDQPDLFGDAPDLAFWGAIARAASEQLAECAALRAAQELCRG